MEPKVSVDWLRFRTQAEVRAGLEALRPMFGPTLGPLLSLESLPRGKDGFEQACAVIAGGLAVGRVDFGGAAMRGWARWNVTGQGCGWVQDWNAVEAVESLPAAEIRRVDLALTTWAGEVSIERVEAAHASGGFTCGGRPPNMKAIDNSDPRKGRTRYVGQRDSDKFFRGYEKGFEMAGGLGALGADMTHIDGHRLEDIFRCEVELKTESRPIPWEVIERREQYFAGSYPFLAELLPEVECDILLRRPERMPQLELRAFLANCKRQYGSALFTALTCYEGDIGRVFEQIVGDKHNADLLAAGVLMVAHD